MGFMDEGNRSTWKCGVGLAGCGEGFPSDSQMFICLDCEVPFHKHCLKKHCEDGWEVLRSELAAVKAENLRMWSVVESAQDVFSVKRPSYHDCLDDGLPECEWCRLENALKALSIPIPQEQKKSEAK